MSVEVPEAGECGDAREHGGAGARPETPPESRQPGDEQPTRSQLVRERFVFGPRGIGSDLFDFAFGFAFPAAVIVLVLWSTSLRLTEAAIVLAISAPPLALLACLALRDFLPFPNFWGAILFFSGWILIAIAGFFTPVALSLNWPVGALASAAFVFTGFSHYRWSELALKLARERKGEQ